MESKKCPVCGTSFLGRLDKKYCSDQCRGTANNKIKRKSERLMIETNRRLRKNRKILKTLCPVGKSTVRKSILIEMGFDFSSFTSMYMPRSGNLYYLCYDYGFSPIIQKGVERALIISKQNYVDDWHPWNFAR